MVLENCIGVHLRKSVRIFRLDWIGKMPFSKVCGGVSLPGKDGPETGKARRIQSCATVRLNPGRHRISPRHHGGARGHAERIGAVGPLEYETPGSQPIHIRRMQILRSHAAAHRVGELLIGCQDQNIRGMRCRRCSESICRRDNCAIAPAARRKPSAAGMRIEVTDFRFS